MEDRETPKWRQYVVMFLSLGPIIILLILSYLAFDWYNTGHAAYPYNFAYVHEPWLIAGLVWLAAVIALAIFLIFELRAWANGKEHRLPAIAFAFAAALNLIMAFLGFFSPAFTCGSAYVTPESGLSATLYLTSMTYGLVLGGVACIGYKSLRRPLEVAMTSLCILSFFFVSSILFLRFWFASGCLASG